MNDSVRQPVFEFAGFRLDAHRRVLLGRDQQPIALTPRLIDLLLYLVERPGRLLTKEELLAAIWPNVVVEEHNLNKAISELRRVLGEKRGEHKFIVTKPGHGYRFVADVSIGSLPQPETALKREAPGEPASGPWSRSRELRLVAAIGTVGLLVAAVGFAVRDAPSASSERGIRVTPLAFEKDGGEIPHVIGSTVWNPDSTAIAYAQTGGDLLTPPRPYVLYLDGSSPMPLTPRPRGLPKQWTKAGQVLLNTSKGPTPTSESAGLLTVPAVGGEPELVFTPPPGTTNILSVTADGQTVAALRRDEHGAWGIWAGSIASGTLERYEPAPFTAMPGGGVPALSFSPDGRRLLLMWQVVGEGEQVWLLPYPPDRHDPPRRVLETLPAYFGTPLFSWLPDNRHIVVSTAERGRPWRLYLADTVSGRFHPLSSDATSTARQLGPVVSPDGRRLVFTEDASHFDVVSINVRTAQVSRTIATRFNEEMPARSADGKRLVYVTNRNGEAEIWLREEDGTDRTLVTSRNFPPGTTGFFLGPELSPDGTRVMYVRVESDARGLTGGRLWMSSLAGGDPVRLRESSAVEHAGSWSPDSAWYVYPDALPDGTHLLKKVRTSGTSEPETLARTGGHPSNAVPIWSPDGRWILVDDDGLKLIAADGSETRDFGVSALCTFARVPETLYCIENLSGIGERKFVVRRFDGTTEVVGSLPVEAWPVASGGPALRLSLSPDGESVTYSAGTPRVQLLLLEGLADVPLP